MRTGLDGYSVGKRLHLTRQSEVHEGVRVLDGAFVVLKSYFSDTPLDPIPRAQREFDSMRKIAGPGVPAALELVRSSQRPTLVLERVPGIQLAHLIQRGPLATRLWLEIALQLSETLGRLHAAGILHRDVCPENVLVDVASRRAWLMDFGLAAEIGSAQKHASGRETAVGTVRYMAPERTGRMNRGCDSRSDVYSLGATLYHALAGRPPFEETDVLELIHAHIARLPPEPKTVRPEVPEALSRLLMKLLAKQPEQRYQRTHTLHADIEACIAQVERDGRIDASLALGAAEIPERPIFPAKIYGREAELAQLQALYGKAHQGSPQLLLLDGEPGAGKSQLVDQLRSVIAGSGGYLAMGRFDPSRERPYGGWIDALGSLVQQWLVEDDERLAQRRETLLGRLGSVAQVAIDLIPDLAFVLGEVPPVPRLGPREAQARLSLALQRFIATATRPAHPLVLFLDNLQWSDSGSCVLLEDVLSSAADPALLVIGAFRAGDGEDEDALPLSISKLEAHGVPLHRMSLRPLTVVETTAMLSDALGRSHDETRPLAECVARKTGCNPLLIREFVLHMHAQGLIHFVHPTGWAWNDAAIAAANIPDGAVGLMVAKLGGLSPASREVIEMASSIGDEFELSFLAELLGRPPASLEPSLTGLLASGLIAPSSGGFRFVHDRIREAAQSLPSRERRAEQHVHIARVLLARCSEAEWVEESFGIAEHLNGCGELLPEDLRLPSIRANLHAAKLALSKGDATTAGKMLEVARALFRDTDWPSQHALGFEIHLLGAESAYQCGSHEQAIALLDFIEPKAASPVEFAQAATKRIQIFALRHPDDCVGFALKALQQLGVRWQRRPSHLRIGLALLPVRWKLRHRDPLSVFQPARSIDPAWVAILLLLRASGPAMARVDTRLLALANALILRRYLRHGYLLGLSSSLAAYAGFRYSNDLGRARPLIDCALSAARQSPDVVLRPRVEVQAHAIFEPFWMNRRQALAALGEVAERAREVGDREFAIYAQFLPLIYRALAGDPIAPTEAALRELAHGLVLGQHNHLESERCHLAYRLLAQDDGDARIEAELASSDAWIAEHPHSTDPYIRTLWMLVLCVYGRYDLAFAQSQALGKRLFEVVPFVHIVDHTFYRGLAAAVLAGTARGAARRRYLRALRVALRKLKRWSRSGPDFVHMLEFLQAERAQLRGNIRGARGHYERTVQRARQQAFVHHAALAHERRGQLMLRLHRETECAAELREALALYRDWGAGTKMRSLADSRRALIG
jgi:histidine kinase